MTTIVHLSDLVPSKWNFYFVHLESLHWVVPAAAASLTTNLSLTLPTPHNVWNISFINYLSHFSHLSAFNKGCLFCCRQRCFRKCLHYCFTVLYQLWSVHSELTICISVATLTLQTTTKRGDTSVLQTYSMGDQRELPTHMESGKLLSTCLMNIMPKVIWFFRFLNFMKMF